MKILRKIWVFSSNLRALNITQSDLFKWAINGFCSRQSYSSSNSVAVVYLCISSEQPSTMFYWLQHTHTSPTSTPMHSMKKTACGLPCGREKMGCLSCRFYISQPLTMFGVWLVFCVSGLKTHTLSQENSKKNLQKILCACPCFGDVSCLTPRLQRQVVHGNLLLFKALNAAGVLW